MNKRILPRVCKRCYKFIFTPISEQICIFDDAQRTKLIEICKECKELSKK